MAHHGFVAGDHVGLRGLRGFVDDPLGDQVGGGEAAADGASRPARDRPRVILAGERHDVFLLAVDMHRALVEVMTGEEVGDVYRVAFEIVALPHLEAEKRDFVGSLG